MIKSIVPLLNSEWFPLLDRYFTVPVKIGGPKIELRDNLENSSSQC